MIYTVLLVAAVIVSIILWYCFIYRKTKGKGIGSFLFTDGIYQYKGVAILVLIMAIVAIAFMLVTY